MPRFEAIFLPEFPVRESPLKNDYAFIDIISKGAYGRVYKVQKRETKEVFALKVISKAKIVAEDSVQQSKQEVSFFFNLFKHNNNYIYINKCIIFQVSIQKAVGHHTFIASSPYHWQGRKTLYICMQYYKLNLTKYFLDGMYV